MKTDTGEVSDDDDEQDDSVVINGDCKLERQNSKQGSIKRQIVKVGRNADFKKKTLLYEEKMIPSR